MTFDFIAVLQKQTPPCRGRVLLLQRSPCRSTYNAGFPTHSPEPPTLPSIDRCHVSSSPLPVVSLRPLLVATCQPLPRRSRPHQLLPIPARHNQLGQSHTSSSPEARCRLLSQMHAWKSIRPSALLDDLRHSPWRQVRGRPISLGLWLRLLLHRHVTIHVGDHMPCFSRVVDSSPSPLATRDPVDPAGRRNSSRKVQCTHGKRPKLLMQN